MPRFLASALLTVLILLAAASAAGSSPSSSARGRKGLIAVTVQRCSQLLAVPASGGPARNLSRNLACNASPAWSSKGEVAFIKAQGPRVGVAVMAPDGSGQRFVTEPAALANHPRWSPVGRRLLYLRETGNVHVVDLDTGTDTTLAMAQYPEWSPDGKEIAGVWILHLLIQKADGSGQRTIPTSASPVGILGWSSTGTIAFAATDGYIWTIRPNGSDERRLTAGFSGAWSPDGTRLAVNRSVNWPAPIVVVREDGTEIATLSQVGESIPAWSPDGSKIAFRVRKRLHIAGASGGPQTVGPTIGFGLPQDFPTWSPDSTTVLVASRRSDWDVIGIDAASGSPKRMLTTTADELFPAFSPDGERVLFSRTADGAGPLFTARPDGRERRELATDSALAGGAWSPDGSRIAYVSADNHLRVTRVQVNAGVGRSIANHVAGGSFSWSPDGRRLVIADSRALYTVRPYRRGKKRILRARPGTRFDWPRWSPHGDLISFTEFENCGEGDGCYGPAWITTVAPSGRGKDRLVKGGGAGWSPDARFLAYTRGEVTLFDVARRTSIVLSQVPSASPPDWRPTCTLRGTVRGDLLRGTARPDLVCGLRGADVITGGPGNDKLFGEEGDDRILARDRAFDVVGCGPGRDTVIADAGDLVGRDCELVERSR